MGASESGPKVVVCGLGPGGPRDLTIEAVQLLEGPDPVFLRTGRHPTVGLASAAQTFDHLYDRAERLGDVYRAIADGLVEAADEHGTVVYGVPGSPLVLERSVAHLRADDRVEVELRPAVSFLDVAWARLGVDPVEESVRLVDGHSFARHAAGERGPLLVAHTHAGWVLSDIKLAVDAGPEMSALVLQGLGTDAERIEEVAWPDLDRIVTPDHLTSLYLPEVSAPVAQELQGTVDLMRRLRQDCPWDREQTHQSLRRYLIEEAYEVLEAIDGLDGDTGYVELEEELGDLWFQVLFHAELATEAGQFTIADVARSVHDKLVSRHPHVFGEVEAVDADAVVSNWEAIKKEEKGRASIMEGIPGALPALTLAEKVLKKAARAGSPASTAAMDATLSELPVELDDDQLGTVLLAVVERARVVGLDPEAALRNSATLAKERFSEGERAGAVPVDWVLG